MRSFRERNPVVVGLLSLAVIAGGFALAFNINRFEGLRGVYSVRARLADAAGLQPGNEVRVAGVRVGRVTSISLAPGAAVVDMEVEGDIRLPRETRVEVRLKTLLGQKYVELVMPRPYLEAAARGDAAQATSGFLEDGDVIPRSQTRVPFEVHQAVTAGTRTLEKVDKRSLRRLVSLLAGTITRSRAELRRAIVAVDDAGRVLSTKNAAIRRLLENSARLSGVLADSDRDLEGILSEAARVLEVLARRRATTSALLAATRDLSGDLAALIEAARASIRSGVTDLEAVLASASRELDSLDAALAEFGTAQEMFGQNIQFGRFLEGHTCSITSSDTCNPGGSPEDPGLPVHGTQPEGPGTLRRAE